MKVSLPQGKTDATAIWFTGLSGAGKSTLAAAVAEQMVPQGIAHQVLDADRIRRHLCPDLGFSQADRTENVRRLVYVASLFADHGITTLIAAVSPLRQMRADARQSFASFLEVFVDAPLAVCEARDPVGLYRKFRSGEVHDISGLDSPYEGALHADVHCRTDVETVAESAAKVLAAFNDLRRRRDSSNE